MALALVKTAPPERKLGMGRDPGLNLWSRFTGMHKVYRDQHAGFYWESLPAIEGNALFFQKLLIKKGKGWI